MTTKSIHAIYSYYNCKYLYEIKFKFFINVIYVYLIITIKSKYIIIYITHLYFYIYVSTKIWYENEI